jgi:hypothetical protein
MSTEVQPKPKSIEEIREIVGMASFVRAMKLAMDDILKEARQEAIAAAEGDDRELVRATTTVEGTVVPLGKLARNPDKTHYAVTDPAAFDEWVGRAHPEWIEGKLTIDTAKLPAELLELLLAAGAEVAVGVKPTWQASLLAQIAAIGEILDESTGEVPPGIEKKTEPGSWVLTPDRAAKVRVQGALRNMLAEGFALPTSVRELIEGAG